MLFDIAAAEATDYTVECLYKSKSIDGLRGKYPFTSQIHYDNIHLIIVYKVSGGIEIAKRRKPQQSRASKTRVNKRIRVPKVRLVDEEGEQMGVVNTSEALAIAQERGLDLVEVSPNSKPPVCRIMDHGKYLYMQSKRKKESRKGVKKTTIKEIKVSAKIGEHDLNFKIGHIEKFLRQGHRVKVSVFFRGREITHSDRGRVVLDEVVKRLGEVAAVETRPRLDGRIMVMLLGPGPDAKKEKKEKEEKEESE